ncbi:MAG: sensor histidine kinase [Acidimicrobiales bacterium]
MIRSERRARGHRVHAVRVAAVAAVLVVLGFGVVAAVLDLLVEHRLEVQVDARLTRRLDEARLVPTDRLRSGLPPDGDDGAAPVFVWEVSPTGRGRSLVPGAPRLPVRRWVPGRTDEATIGATPFRFHTTRDGNVVLVAGVSAAQIVSIRDDLLASEGILAGVLLVAVYLGAFAVGVKASAPVEEIRRRQAEFTADASHELRTPLSVIEAEVELALSRPRTGPSYRDTLGRVAGEGRRLRRIVDDLLWLARVDTEDRSAVPQRSAVDAVARGCVDRFQAVAAGRRVSLTFDGSSAPGSVIDAAPEWVDRLVGVLVDNACKYAGSGGAVAVRVIVRGNRCVLQVDDSGPGIPPAERSRVFDRFHRADDAPGGTGLGLAIADSVVRRTHGRWNVGDSPLGGTRMEVSWKAATGLVHPSAVTGPDPGRGLDGVDAPVGPGTTPEG